MSDKKGTQVATVQGRTETKRFGQGAPRMSPCQAEVQEQNCCCHAELVEDAPEPPMHLLGSHQAPGTSASGNCLQKGAWAQVAEALPQDRRKDRETLQGLPTKAGWTSKVQVPLEVE